jgi:hypothetical protein
MMGENVLILSSRWQDGPVLSTLPWGDIAWQGAEFFMLARTTII